MSTELSDRPGRIMSIDALRGFDMFMITGGHHLAAILAALFTMPRAFGIKCSTSPGKDSPPGT